MTSHEERAHIKRAMGIGEHQNANGTWETVLGETKYAVYVDGIKYPATLIKGEFCTWISGRPPVCEESLDKLRDKVIAELAAPRQEEGQLVYIHGLGMVKVTFPVPSASRVTP